VDGGRRMTTDEFFSMLWLIGAWFWAISAAIEAQDTNPRATHDGGRVSAFCAFVCLLVHYASSTDVTATA